MAASLRAGPGVQLRILLERVDHSFVGVSPLHEFHSGDRIHLQVVVSEPTNICVLGQTEPDFSIDPAGLRLDRPHMVLGPVHLKAGESDLGAITLDESPGVENFYVVAASHPADRPTVIQMSLRHAN